MKNENAWQRRKHRATKPNWIVRSTYNTVDWFGDFNGLRRSAASRLGKSILAVVDITILLCLFFFSAIHSFEMLETFGVTGITQWLAIVFFEVQFLHSSISLDIAKRKGEKAGNRRAIFIICLAFVEVSNITALWGNWGGVLIGAVMPIMLLLSKGSFKDKKVSEVTEETPTKITNISAEIPEQKTPDNQLVLLEEKQEPVTKMEIKTETPLIENNDQKIDVESTEKEVELASKPDEKVLADIKENDVVLIENLEAENPEETIEPSEKVTKISEQIDVENESKKQTETFPPTIKEVDENQATSPVENPIEESSKVTELPTKKMVENQPLDVTDQLVKKEENEPSNIAEIQATEVVENRPEDTKKMIQELTEEITKNIPAKSRERKKTIEKTTKLALRMYTKKGKAPTREELITKAKCSQNIAKDVLKEVKQWTSKVS